MNPNNSSTAGSRIRPALAHEGLPFTLFVIRGVGGLLPRFWIPFTWAAEAGVGAPDPSSSTLTPEGRLRLFEAGDVLALGPLELVPCWLC
jgi:hypothetical protein